MAKYALFVVRRMKLQVISLWINYLALFVWLSQQQAQLKQVWQSSWQRIQREHRKIFDGMVICTCWNIQKEHNGRVFEQKYHTLQHVLRKIQEDIAQQEKACSKFNLFSLSLLSWLQLSSFVLVDVLMLFFVFQGCLVTHELYQFSVVNTCFPCLIQGRSSSYRSFERKIYV